MARPTKLTPEVQQRIVAAIRAGNYAEPAARSAGVSEATYYRWMQRGRNQTRGIYRDFHDAVRGAEADAEVEAVAFVRKAMREDWRACMSYLARRHPDRWGRHERHEHTGEGGSPVRISEQAFQDPELRKLLNDAGRRLAKHR